MLPFISGLLKQSFFDGTHQRWFSNRSHFPISHFSTSSFALVDGVRPDRLSFGNYRSILVTFSDLVNEVSMIWSDIFAYMFFRWLCHVEVVYPTSCIITTMCFSIEIGDNGVWYGCRFYFLFLSGVLGRMVIWFIDQMQSNYSTVSKRICHRSTILPPHGIFLYKRWMGMSKHMFLCRRRSHCTNCVRRNDQTERIVERDIISQRNR